MTLPAVPSLTSTSSLAELASVSPKIKQAIRHLLIDTRPYVRWLQTIGDLGYFAEADLVLGKRERVFLKEQLGAAGVTFAANSPERHDWHWTIRGDVPPERYASLNIVLTSAYVDASIFAQVGLGTIGAFLTATPAHIDGLVRTIVLSRLERQLTAAHESTLASISDSAQRLFAAGRASTEDGFLIADRLAVYVRENQRTIDRIS